MVQAVLFSLLQQTTQYLFIYLFIGRESKRTYMTDGVKKSERSMQYERVHVLHNI